jgi:site-specific recombinase XerD
VAIAAERFLSRPNKPVGPTDTAKIQEITARFGSRFLNEISDREWNDFIDQRLEGRAPATRERYLNALLAFLNWCCGNARRWVDRVPEFERKKEARRPTHRRALRVNEMTPELIELMIDNAAPHLAGQMAAFWATGGRVKSVLHQCRLCDYVAAEGREQLTFQTTKNGDPVVAAFHPAAARVMRRYLEWRGKLWDREGPLFLTDEREPYAETHGAWSSQSKTAWRSMRRRTVKALRQRAIREILALRREGRRQEAIERIAETKDRCRVVLQITPHWFRHHLATFMLSSGADIRSVMAQGGWRNMDVVLGYAHDVPEKRRSFVRRMAIGTSLPRPFEPSEKKGDNSAGSVNNHLGKVVLYP